MSWTAWLVSCLTFQAGWFACVLGAARGTPIAGVVLVAALVTGHLALSRRRLADAAFLGASGLFGYAADSALVLAGWIRFPEPAALGGPSALWMVALWVLFASTLEGCMSWLRDRWVLAAGLGAVSGPLSYLAGARLGAIELAEPAAAPLAAIGVTWAAAMPVLLALHGATRRLFARGSLIPHGLRDPGSPVPAVDARVLPREERGAEETGS